MRDTLTPPKGTPALREVSTRAQRENAAFERRGAAAGSLVDAARNRARTNRDRIERPSRFAFRPLPGLVAGEQVAPIPADHGLRAVASPAPLNSKLVASNSAVPIMVATVTLNGAIRRVPSMGTSHTNMSLLSTMYCTV